MCKHYIYKLDVVQRTLDYQIARFSPILKCDYSIIPGLCHHHFCHCYQIPRKAQRWKGWLMLSCEVEEYFKRWQSLEDDFWKHLLQTSMVPYFLKLIYETFSTILSNLQQNAQRNYWKLISELGNCSFSVLPHNNARCTEYFFPLEMRTFSLWHLNLIQEFQSHPQSFPVSPIH